MVLVLSATQGAQTAPWCNLIVMHFNIASHDEISLMAECLTRYCPCESVNIRLMASMHISIAAANVLCAMGQGWAAAQHSPHADSPARLHSKMHKAQVRCACTSACSLEPSCITEEQWKGHTCCLSCPLFSQCVHKDYPVDPVDMLAPWPGSAGMECARMCGGMSESWQGTCRTMR